MAQFTSGDRVPGWPYSVNDDDVDGLSALDDAACSCVAILMLLGLLENDVDVDVDDEDTVVVGIGEKAITFSFFIVANNRIVVITGRIIVMGFWYTMTFL
jgi:hypothetical protein